MNFFQSDHPGALVGGDQESKSSSIPAGCQNRTPLGGSIQDHEAETPVNFKLAAGAKFWEEHGGKESLVSYTLRPFFTV